jgi:molybdenum cofactor cytidylyltransferase
MQYDNSPSRQAIAAIVLAAGSSSRMGAHKLLLPLGSRSVIAWSVAAACASQASDVIVVLGRDAVTVQAALDPGRFHTLTNQAYARGQGTSLAIALAAVPQLAIGVVVLLGDQPFMTAAAINHVLIAARHEPDRIVMGLVGERTGHPVYLPRRLFGELVALNGDAGARDIVARERAQVVRAPLHNDLAHLDIDTLEDYQRARALAYRLQEPGA